MLELAKHLFAVDHVVFALAVNRSELAHSVKVLYGQDFDADVLSVNRALAVFLGIAS